MLSNVAVLYHPGRPRAIIEAQALEQELVAEGVRASVGDGWNPHLVKEFCHQADLLVALGGDGTILHVARLAAPFKLPTLGVNLGRVGFLAELTPETLHQQVRRIAHGDYWVERRAMLDVALEAEESESLLCLNEVAVGRGTSPRAVHVQTSLDDEAFMTFTADGVLIATATGSTAYSLAAGGPILYPQSSDILITPVAPHLHIGRSLIVPGDVKVSLRLTSDQPAILSVDGSEERAFGCADSVHVSQSKLLAHFARLGPQSYFYSAIAERLR